MPGSNHRWWVRRGCDRCHDIQACAVSSSDLLVIAERLGMQPRSVVRHLERHGEWAVIDRLTNVPRWVA